MAVGVFTINFDGMDDAIRSAAHQAQDIAKAIEHMHRVVGAKTDTTWVGSAATEFESTYLDCRNMAHSLPAKLEGAADTLRAISTGTSDSETTNAARFRRH